jgi:hypothetical protein
MSSDCLSLECTPVDRTGIIKLASGRFGHRLIAPIRDATLSCRAATETEKSSRVFLRSGQACQIDVHHGVAPRRGVEF